MIISGKNIAVLLALGGLVIPVTYRILSSPFTLLLLSPLFLLILILGFLALNITLGYALDSARPAPRNALPSAARPLAFSTPAAWQAVLTRSQWSHKAPQSLPPLYPDAPVVSAAVNDILIMIVRDFVLVWYKEISASPSFPTAVSSTLHSSMDRLLTRVMALDLPALVVKRILPKVTSHIEQFRQSEVALRGAGLERKLTQSEELDLLLASRYAARGGGKLHSAVENLSSTFTKQSEEAHLRGLIEKALPAILPEKEANSRAVKLVVREIVACAVLFPIMEMMSDPDFWNRMIDQIAGAAIRQQRLISKVRGVLEAQLPRPQAPLSDPTQPTTENITIRTDAKQFESFLRSINRTSSLLDARRLRNDIMGEVRRTRTLLANNANSDWINGEKTEDIVAFLDRLYTAKRQVEKRIVVLGGEADSRQTIYQETPTNSSLSLRDVLTNPSSLSYLMEFMDRRQRSLLVQFWLTVESFKNPLESVDTDDEGDQDESLLDPSQSATLREDISLINELYFSNPLPDPVLRAVAQKNITTIRSFGQDAENSTAASERRVRRSVMLAQRQVEREMEQDFEDFQRSELWFRVVADIEANGRAAPADDFALISGRRSPVASRHDVEHAPARAHPVVKAPLSRSESAPLFGGPARAHSPPTTAPVLSRPAASSLQVLMSPVHELDSQTASIARAPLFDDPEDQEQQEQSQRMDAIQAALTDIIALDKQHDQPHGSSSSDSLSIQGSALTTGSTARERKRRLMFADEIEEDDGTVAAEAEDDKDDHEHGSFQLAGPGDLQLSHEIERLAGKVAKLQTQDAMLDTLIKKAELTGDAQELRLLRRSKSQLTRELRELRFQKTQYEQQESANRLLSDRSRVAIVNSTTGDEEGKQVVRYLIEVQQLAPDGSFSSGWVVARRYNEFFSMHNKLKDKYMLVRNLDFPGKRLVTALSASFVDNRRVALEKYLQSLITIPAVCESEELRAFLSRDSPFMTAEATPTPKTPTTPGPGSAFPGHGLVKTMYQSVAESIDDMFFGPSMLDVIIQRLTTQAGEFVGITGTAVRDEDLVAQALKASGKTTYEDALAHLSGDLKPLEGETSTSSFSSPICDLLLAVFELDKKNNWLRRQAVVIILQQVLGDTIERRSWRVRTDSSARKLRETVKAFLDESHLMTFINAFKDGLWPGGKLKPPSVPRTVEEKLRTRDEANRKLSSLMPDLAANMIGRSNARRGARRIFAVLQNRRLNQHLVYTIVDEVFAALFSETATA
ncbi:PhoX domain-containing protein [Epithele typhae]|uniref:PhoX domain-containing protein n=1 Tax=Epithele typhae TaxID=378194 RepID=UPI0020085998|nr:PhoX domain-containing protein [Epithele typhae]KAH9932024.1 PhoX domain-containing protein [Epithele typhae]